MKKIKITIIGLGLIGGSLGLLLKKKTKSFVVGFSRHRKTLREAIEFGAIDQQAKSLEESVREADIIFIATPISTIPNVFKQIAGLVKPHTIITDIGSVKTNIVEQALKILPQNVSFIGGHPMAGKEKSGIDNANINLLKNCTWILTPTKNTNKQSLQKLISLINQIGCKPVILNTEFHDKAVAGISHLPAILSSILCAICGEEKDWIETQKLAAEGFRDTSRIAANPPLLHTDFCLSNQNNINKLINNTIKELKNFQCHINKKDKQQLLLFFQKAQRIRNEWFVNSRFYPSKTRRK